MHFKKSKYEISYCDTKIQPLLDDLARICTSLESAQAGNLMIESAMESKLLDLNLDKLGYILDGSKKIIQKMKSEIKDYPFLSIRAFFWLREVLTPQTYSHSRIGSEREKSTPVLGRE